MGLFTKKPKPFLEADKLIEKLCVEWKGTIRKMDRETSIGKEQSWDDYQRFVTESISSQTSLKVHFKHIVTLITLFFNREENLFLSGAENVIRLFLSKCDYLVTFSGNLIDADDHKVRINGAKKNGISLLVDDSFHRRLLSNNLFERVKYENLNMKYIIDLWYRKENVEKIKNLKKNEFVEFVAKMSQKIRLEEMDFDEELNSGYGNPFDRLGVAMKIGNNLGITSSKYEGLLGQIAGYNLKLKFHIFGESSDLE